MKKLCRYLESTPRMVEKVKIGVDLDDVVIENLDSDLARCGNDNDNDNDTLREVPHQSNEGLALQARVSGPWPLQKKNLFYWRSLLIGKVCKYKLLWTECNASRLEMNSMYKKNNKETRSHRQLLR